MECHWVLRYEIKHFITGQALLTLDVLKHELLSLARYQCVALPKQIFFSSSTLARI